jgi:exodeoxyribonuclease V alpha subunit
MEDAEQSGQAAHVSVRLFWHDSGWDGAICHDPAANVWCEAHDHVREHKSPRESEAGVAGRPPDESGVRPGCEMSLQAFSQRRNEIRIWPPEWMAANGVKPIDFEVADRTAGMWPYENMWTDDGGHRSNDERRVFAREFFSQIEEGKSLALFYVDERNPLFVEDGERSAHRVLVGISRITECQREIQEWNETTWNGETNMVWSVPFKHAYPKDGIRLPVQAIERAVSDPAERARYLVALDGELRSDFRYGSTRVSPDRAVAVVERAITALSRLRRDGVIEQDVDAQIEWLNCVLLELWEDRGPYPGAASLLLSLDCPRATEISRHALPAIAAEGRDPADALFEALEGNLASAFTDFEEAIEDAADEWAYLDETEKELARLLIRMDLSSEQFAVALDEQLRVKHGLPKRADDLSANPYLLCETFQPKKDDEPISFMTVDHGLVPHDSMAALRERRVSRRDPRRLRALLTEVLRTKAGEGHTFVRADEALVGAAERSPDDRPCEVPLQRLAHPKVASVLEETIERFAVEDEVYLGLRSLREDEVTIAATFDLLAGRDPEPSERVEWQDIADHLAAEGAEAVSLSPEQKQALDRSFHSSLTAITGAAGTGKSTLLRPLIRAIVEKEGEVPIRALTPTGKAADRLKGLHVDAMTIHRALTGAEWYDHELGIWRESERRIEVHTLIIDECSMVDIELMATLMRATDWEQVRRLVLVGDHHQLSPIGPGRPFFDLIATMQAADRPDAEEGIEARPGYAGKLSELEENFRVEAGSNAIAFANSFCGTPVADEPLIWEGITKGQDLKDLRIRYWKDHDELYEMLLADVEDLVTAECENRGVEFKGRSGAFDASIGHRGSPFGPSHWQILAPTRGGPHGTRKLNALLQDRYHGWAKQAKRLDTGAYVRWPVRLGEEPITTYDKVMQTSNQLRPYWRKGEKKDSKARLAVFNGQIGTVRRTWPAALHRYRGKHKSERGRVRSVAVQFEGMPDVYFDYGERGWLSVDRNLELAYAISVHKGQGSEFQHVIFVVPRETAEIFGRELTYTGLTRARTSLTLLVEQDVGPLLSLRKHAAARTPQRNSRLFSSQVGALPYRAGRLVYGTIRGDRVASKSELIIADLLHRYEQAGKLSYAYERELFAPGGDRSDFRLPDFTIHVGGRTFYWEHCGMMDDPSYRDRWRQVRFPWYKRNGYADSLIVTEDGEENPIDSGWIEREIVNGRLLA